MHYSAGNAGSRGKGAVFGCCRSSCVPSGSSSTPALCSSTIYACIAQKWGISGRRLEAVVIYILRRTHGGGNLLQGCLLMKL